MPYSVLPCSEFGTVPWFLRLWFPLPIIFAFLMHSEGEVWLDSNGEPFAVDGRKAHQWIASVLAYLDWRAGDSWRPASHRFHPERECYVRAHRVVFQTFNQTSFRDIPPRAQCPDRTAAVGVCNSRVTPTIGPGVSEGKVLPFCGPRIRAHRRAA